MRNRCEILHFQKIRIRFIQNVAVDIDSFSISINFENIISDSGIVSYGVYIDLSNIV